MFGDKKESLGYRWCSAILIVVIICLMGLVALAYHENEVTKANFISMLEKSPEPGSPHVVVIDRIERLVGNKALPPRRLTSHPEEWPRVVIWENLNLLREMDMSSDDRIDAIARLKRICKTLKKDDERCVWIEATTRSIQARLP